eukprot:TRINITY_DN5306_c0_g1_i3.p1 TRINITY_DN5306_c0_g1~~TRINITY_DN5306_c0_g1_i3.p1  ORF type:complete len:500 (-),score=133.51 TRINITY_DN5306_c0_g1_i3:177-1676(-)
MDERARTETRQEAKILAVLKHPCIVNFREVFVTVSDKLCIVMDFAEGGDLQRVIREARGNYFTESQILDWFTQICLGLKHVHDRKILHRDIKAQNIFLTRNSRCLLGDFGIAKILSATKGFAHTVIGTPYYLSPEIIERNKYSFKSDIWSLGVLLYELCALKQPFDAINLHLLALRIVEGNYPPIPGHYSEGLKGLVRKLLVVDPKKRPSVNEILETGIIQRKVRKFLSEEEYEEEFSHTMLHNVDVMRQGLCSNKAVPLQLKEKKRKELKKGIGKLKGEERRKSEFIELKQIEGFKAARRRIEESERKHLPAKGDENKGEVNGLKRCAPILRTPRVRAQKPLASKYEEPSEQRAKESLERKRDGDKRREEERMKMRRYIDEQRKLARDREVKFDVVVKKEVVKGIGDCALARKGTKEFIGTNETPEISKLEELKEEEAVYREDGGKTSASTCREKEDTTSFKSDKELVQDYLEQRFKKEAVQRVVDSIRRAVLLLVME